jgi:dTDP-glucose 4,6-dehydratase
MKGCEAVLHLAALIAIPFSYHSPSTYVETNVNGTLNILQAARDFNVGRIVHTSTSEVYGTARYVPIDEEHPLQGQSPYSATKIAADQLAYAFYSSFDLPVVILRPFNTYGPRQSARAVIPTIITQIANKANSINLGSLAPTRDFSFVSDTVSGFISALNSNKGQGQVFNLGSNFEISIEDTVNLISDIMEVSVQINSDKQRLRPENSEVERLWADNRRAKEILNWKPKLEGINGFKKGLIETIDWYLQSENLNTFKSGIYNL